MSGIYRIIPSSERAYEWARGELKGYFKNPDHFRVHKLNELKPSKKIHVSIFHLDGRGPDIWRVYWEETDSVKYSILENYQELKKNHPEIVAELEKAGKEAYEREYDRKKRYESKYGKSVNYRPLSAIMEV
ncbi:MAG: hypothetical protein MJ154_01475 [Candidatus Saccharibacteria bacterium]|nr:hypothetical protein [Candidatus Saccharibacteria bacterium]